jgi:hypothetical protein
MVRRASPLAVGAALSVWTPRVRSRRVVARTSSSSIRSTALSLSSSRRKASPARARAAHRERAWRRDGVFRPRHRGRSPAGPASEAVRALLAGTARRPDGSRSGARDRPRHRGSARRPDLGRKRARRGKHFFLQLAHRGPAGSGAWDAFRARNRPRPLHIRTSPIPGSHLGPPQPTAVHRACFRTSAGMLRGGDTSTAQVAPRTIREETLPITIRPLKPVPWLPAAMISAPTSSASRRTSHAASPDRRRVRGQATCQDIYRSAHGRLGTVDRSGSVNAPSTSDRSSDLERRKRG